MVEAPVKKRCGAGSISRPTDGAGMIEAHRGLIYRYARKRVKPGVEEDDLFQAGAIAIIEAAEKHDPEREAFSTVADFYLKIEMNEAEARGSISTPATLPRSTLGRVRAIRRAVTELHAGGETSPSTPEIAQEAGLSLQRTQRLLPLMGSTLSPGTYLSTPVGEDGDGELPDMLPAQAEDPAESACLEDEHRRLLGAVENLPEGERAVIAAYYGLGAQPGADLGQLSGELGLSKQALHQRLRRARERLLEALSEERHSSRAAA